MGSFSARWSIAFFAIAAVTLWASASLAATILIPAAQPTIQAGIEAALSGDLVLVAPGTYVENINFLGKEITVQSESGSDVTVIDGNQAGSVVYFDNGETEGAVLEGFAIRNGNAYDGGGIFCLSSSPTITNCTISENIALADGGGIHCRNSSSPTIMNCKILENNGKRGGGISCSDGASPTITKCTISGNSALYESGGGINCSTNSSLMVTNCTITGNSARDVGGGLRCYESSITITNCTISGNIADISGGGIYCGVSDPTITNCILWGDSAPNGPEIYVCSGLPVIIYSDVQGGWSGEGNIDADPLFLGGGDYHLTLRSPCIDSGTDAWIYTDIDGEARPLGIGFDMGADEYTNPDCWDGDMDGYGDVACGGYDCDDTNPDINPGEEICDNGIDDDCDGLVDLLDPDCCDDADGDGFTDPTCGGTDCDDTDPEVYPGAEETCYNGIDDDCDELIDFDDLDCEAIRIPSDYPTIQAGIDASLYGDLVLVPK